MSLTGWSCFPLNQFKNYRYKKIMTNDKTKTKSSAKTQENNIDGLPELAKQYLMYLATIKNSSKLTVREYIFDLRVFFRFMKSRKLNHVNYNPEEFGEIDISDINIEFIKTITKEDIFEFLFFMSEQRDNINNSRARKLSAVKGFFKYLTKQAGKLDVNPAENIESPTIKQALPKYLSLEESVDLLNSVKNDENNKNRIRDYCIITLFLNCGMRLSELTGINLTDISLDLTSIRIMGKGRKERFVYLNEPCVKALADYLETKRNSETNNNQPKLIKDENALFISRNRRRISNSAVQKMLDTSFFKAGLSDKNYSPHKLRHTAATLMYQNGVDTRILQEILGHENLNTTQIYTHVANSQLAEAANKNPLSKIEKINRNKK
ncbi:MAG: tyrosine recombinase XerC [Oscillospiraceae bacterium]|nr:tyrosine recombinase XerC [Oscillospiraceae bacterium]